MERKSWLLIVGVTAILVAGCGRGPSDPNMPGDMMQVTAPAPAPSDTGAAVVTR